MLLRIADPRFAQEFGSGAACVERRWREDPRGFFGELAKALCRSDGRETSSLSIREHRDARQDRFIDWFLVTRSIGHCLRNLHPPSRAKLQATSVCSSPMAVDTLAAVAAPMKPARMRRSSFDDEG